MSTIFLHVGQCGNQLGEAFWQGVEEASAPPDRLGSISLKKVPPQPERSRSLQTGQPARHLPFSLLDGTLPCILVDTEPKVVRRITKGGVLSTKIPPEFRLVERAGRGNNWACGYHGNSHVASQVKLRSGRFGGRGEETQLKESVMGCVRKLVEKCDRFTGSVLFHSLAGGTGSGSLALDLSSSFLSLS